MPFRASPASSSAGAFFGSRPGVGLQQRGHDVALFEAAPRAGGVIGSRLANFSLSETVPQHARQNTPLIDALLDELAVVRATRCARGRVDAIHRCATQAGAVAPQPRRVSHHAAFHAAANLRLCAEPFIRADAARQESRSRWSCSASRCDFLLCRSILVSGIYSGDP